MSVDCDQVCRSAMAFIEALSKLSAREREKVPAAHYGENFNQIIKLAKEAAPNVDERLWPKPITFKQPVGGGIITEARYVELETYARQIVNLLPDEPLGPMVG